MEINKHIVLLTEDEVKLLDAAVKTITNAHGALNCGEFINKWTAMASKIKSFDKAALSFYSEELKKSNTTKETKNDKESSQDNK